MENVDLLIRQLAAEDDEAREAAKAELEDLCRGPKGAEVRSYLESAGKGLNLEVKWEIEEVLEHTAPPKPVAAPPPAPPPPPAASAPKKLSAADLDLVYQDPRGLAIHKTKVGERWFATQVDPATGRPQTFELHPEEVAQLKKQLGGSPYWNLGSAR